MRSCQRVFDGGLAQNFRQANVRDFHAAFLVEQNIFRLDVAVNDPFNVRELQRLADLGDDGDRFKVPDEKKLPVDLCDRQPMLIT